MELNTINMALAAGIVFGLMMFVTTIVSIYTGYGADFLNVMVSIYPGYVIDPVGAIIGMVYGFIDAFILVYIVTWIYNWLENRNSF